MKKTILHITSFLLAFMLLISTFSFTVGMHYCGDTLVDTAIISEVKGCGIEKSTTITPSGNVDCKLIKMDCCSDHHLSIEGQNELKITDYNFNLEQQLFFTSFLYSYINVFEEFSVKENYFKDYKPPPILRFIYKLDESYLI